MYERRMNIIGGRYEYRDRDVKELSWIFSFIHGFIFEAVIGFLEWENKWLGLAS